MPGENPYQYGQPTSNGAPQPPAFYPPPPAYPGAPTHTPHSAPRQDRPRERSAFADIPVGDYVRDGVTAGLLLVSFFLPWSTAFSIARGGSGGIIALVVLLTLLSLASLGLPYFARLGMLGQNWQVSQLRVLRLAVNAPLIATVVVFVFYDAIRGMFRFSETASIISGDGIGSAAWFGLAGALLAAAPRAAELRIDPRGGPRWLGWIKPLLMIAVGFSVASGVLSLIFILVSANRYDYFDGAYTLRNLIVILATSAIPVAVLGLIAAGINRSFDSWRLTIAGLGVAVLISGFFLSFDDLSSVELFHPLMTNPYYSITFVVAAAAIAFLPYAVPSTSDATHAGYIWLDAARNGVRIIVVWSFGTAISHLVMAATGFGPVSVGEAIALAVFSVLIGILAVVGSKALALRYTSEDPRPSREVIIGICLGLLVLMVGRLVTQSIMHDYGYPSVWTFDLATAVVTIFIALAVAVAPAVRDLYSGVPLFASVTAGPAPIGQYGQPDPRQPYNQPTQHDLSSAAPTAAADPRTPAATLFEIATKSPELRPAVAANPSAYDDLIAWLGKLGDPAVDAALARRALGQFGLPAESAHNASSQSAVNDSGVQADSSEARAADPNTPAATLFEIATTSPELRSAVAANPSTYDDLVNWLGKLGDPAVDAALARRALGQFGLPAAVPRRTDTESPEQGAGATASQASARALAAADPGTPAAALFDIASNSPDLRAAVAANPKTYDDLLTWLGKLGNPDVDAALASRALGNKASAQQESSIPASTPQAFSTPEPAPTPPVAPAEPVATAPADATSAVDSTPLVDATPTIEEAATQETTPTPTATVATEVLEIDEDTRAVSDPTCSAAILFRAAEHRPDLRATVAAHPNAYPGLLEWLGALGDSAVNDALARRP
ncbi:hypothetical protein CH289_17935 [Rhodococcus sp. RS1C4]|nr:hypothetical protein [Rhodococcus sp. RS1C4]OZC49062.1 hypothetical protein CH289_17935 [Rhodococcus sp. RS1C4]